MPFLFTFNVLNVCLPLLPPGVRCLEPTLKPASSSRRALGRSWLPSFFVKTLFRGGFFLRCFDFEHLEHDEHFILDTDQKKIIADCATKSKSRMQNLEWGELKHRH